MLFIHRATKKTKVLCFLEKSVIIQHVWHNTSLNTCVGVHPVGIQVAGNRDPFSGSRYVWPRCTVDCAIPSFLILMNPVSLKYGRGASPFIGSRIEGFPGVQSHAMPPFRGVGTTSIVPPLPWRSRPKRSTYRVRVIGEALLIIVLIKRLRSFTERVPRWILITHRLCDARSRVIQPRSL